MTQHKRFLAALKPWILPIAMVIGIVFHSQIGALSFLSKYLIFLMLLITYSRVSLRHFSVDKSMPILLSIQIIGAVITYLALIRFNKVAAEAIAMCFFCSTATAAPVITGMLGGSIEKVAVFSLFSNLAIAFLGPFLLAIVSDINDLTFTDSFLSIAQNVLPLIIGPLILALLFRRFTPKVSNELATHQGLSFYIWAVALIIVVGNSVSFVLREPPSEIPTIAIIALLSLAACLIQFYLGRKAGKKYGDPISGAQSLGQKNTVLAIWLCLTYLNPLSSVGPAFYIIWHNTVNSWQITKSLKTAR